MLGCVRLAIVERTRDAAVVGATWGAVLDEQAASASVPTIAIATTERTAGMRPAVPHARGALRPDRRNSHTPLSVIAPLILLLAMLGTGQLVPMHDQWMMAQLQIAICTIPFTFFEPMGRQGPLPTGKPGQRPVRKGDSMTDAVSTEPAQGAPAVAVQAAGDTAGVAADQSRNVAASASEQAKAVANQATSQVRSVTDEARQQASRVVGDASTEFRTQMEQRLTQLVHSTRGASDQLRALHEGRTEEAGQARDLARQASDKLGGLADRADELGLQGVTDEVARFARRRPLAFLAAAAVGGVAAARLMRSVQATTGSPDSGGAGTGQASLPASTRAPAAPAEVGTLGGPTGAVVPGETGLGVTGPALGGNPSGIGNPGGVG